ncbi:MAG: S8 family serine peptidase [Promethearchaeota archaeon]
MDIDKVDSKITGKDVYIAILDTGLTSYWKEFIPEDRIQWGWVRHFHDLAMDFEVENGYYPDWGGWDSIIESRDIVASNEEYLDEGHHGTKLISYITGWFYNDPYTGNYYFFKGIAPGAKIIPIKVYTAYQVDDGIWTEFCNDYTMASGIKYITELAEKHPNKRFIIEISSGWQNEIIGETIIPWYEMCPEIIGAVYDAIDAGVVVVASAGNNGFNYGGYRGMVYPAALDEVISAGASFWLDNEWVPYELNDDGTAKSYNPLWFMNDVPEDNPELGLDNGDYSGVSQLCSRALIEIDDPNDPQGYQELDVFVPSGFAVGPGKLPGGPDPYSMYYYDDTLHYVGATSGAAPQLAGIIALMLQANPDLSVSEVETILKESADEIAPWYFGYYFIPPYPLPGYFYGGMLPTVWGILPFPFPPEYQDIGLDLGSGLAQADSAVEMAKSYI